MLGTQDPNHQLWRPIDDIQILALSLTSYVTLGKVSLHLNASASSPALQTITNFL